MPRKKRIWYPGAMYHIMTRGNRRSDIFRDYEDFRTYTDILFSTKDRLPFYLYAYCLMDNHIHLQIETIDVPIWEIMMYLNSLYSRYFNDRYNLIGHLFQGRYYAELITTDSHMLQTNRYIHLNPVKAHMIEHAINYMWSSYRDYLGFQSTGLVNTDKLLSLFLNTASFQHFTEDPKYVISDLLLSKKLEDD